MAREKGLEPLARLIFAQELKTGQPLELAAIYVNPEKGAATPEEAIAGAQDILAEELSEDASLRQELRDLFWQTGYLASTATARASGAAQEESAKKQQESSGDNPSREVQKTAKKTKGARKKGGMPRFMPCILTMKKRRTSCPAIGFWPLIGESGRAF